MMKVQFFILVALLTGLLSLNGCKNKDDEASPGSGETSNKREVKYKITGNYSGYLDVNYTNEGGTITSVKVTSLPWSVELTCESSVYAVAVGGSSEIGTNLGTPGQTVTLKIYSAGKQVKTQSSTADQYGSIYIPSVAHGF